MPVRIKNMLKSYVEGLSEIIGQNLKKVILYGSYARGEQDKNGEISDIDILILVDTGQEQIKEYEKKVLDYSYDLNLKYNILLAPIIENIDNYNMKIKYIEFYKNIKREGVLLKG